MSKYRLRILNNENLNCSVSSCLKRRSGLSKYCRGHALRLNLYGSPLGTVLLKHTYKQELVEVKDFILRHSEHQAVKAAITFFDRWLEDAYYGFPVLAKEQFSKLFEHGIRGKDCIEVFLSIWLYSHRFYSKLPDDARLSYALSIGIFSLKDKSKVKASVKKAVGERLRQALGIFAGNVITAIEREVVVQEALRNDLFTPFKER